MNIKILISLEYLQSNWSGRSAPGCAKVMLTNNVNFFCNFVSIFAVKLECGCADYYVVKYFNYNNKNNSNMVLINLLPILY